LGLRIHWSRLLSARSGLAANAALRDVVIRSDRTDRRSRYDAATAKSIAIRAGVNEALIHRYFVSKVGLLQAIFRSAIESEKKNEPYPAGMTVEEEISNFFQERITDSASKLPLVRLILSRAVIDPEIAKLFRIEEVCPPVLAILQKRLKAFQKRGF
jgi:AcrR family transcriptional regulator